MSNQHVVWVQINARVSKELRDKVRSQAEIEDRTVSAVIRRALAQYLENQTQGEAKAA